MPPLENSAEVAARWRARGEEVRAAAEGMHDPIAKRIMLNIAQTYERLAERAEAASEAPASKKPAVARA